jgi:ferredoxin
MTASVKRDPLAIAAIVILVLAAVLMIYGFIPREQPVYQQIASGQVPITDQSGNFMSDTQAETYFQKSYTGAGSLDRVTCYPDQSGYYCYGFQLEGMATSFSFISRYYGGGLLALGVVSYYASTKLEPLRPRASLARPIRIRIDEDICVSNSVCVNLAPTVFQLRKQDAPTLLAPVAYVVDPEGADSNTILIAAEMCPTGAIVIEDAETGERIHPPLPRS